MEISGSFVEMLHEIRNDSKVANALLSRFVDTSEGNFLSYAGGNISFLPDSVAGETEDAYAAPARQSMKAARGARKFIREDIIDFELSDQDFEIFTNKIKSVDITESGVYGLVEGDDIIPWYNGRNYVRRGGGTLERSCMRYDECGTYFNIYTKNSETVKMLILTNKETGKLYGRALVWFLAEGIFMDRVYGNDAIAEAFKNYATAEGWSYRYRNTYTDETKFVVNGKLTEVCLKIPLTYVRSRQYPYLDTFKYLNKDEGWISNDSNTNYQYLLTSTTGGAHAR